MVDRSPKQIEIGLPHDSRLESDWIIEDLVGWPAADHPKIKSEVLRIEGLSRVYGILEFSDDVIEYFFFGPWGWTETTKEEVVALRPRGSSYIRESEW